MFRNGGFSQRPSEAKNVQKAFFRALTCLGVFSAAGGALKTKNSIFYSNLINFQNASRSMNPSRFHNFLDPLKFSFSSFGEADIFSKPSDWANFWNLNRCDVRIDIFERILDVHQEFCDVQSRQILTIKLKNLEYRQFSMWQKWWKILMYINFSSKYVDADNISLRIPKNSSNGWFREDIWLTKAWQRKV